MSSEHDQGSRKKAKSEESQEESASLRKQLEEALKELKEIKEEHEQRSLKRLVSTEAPKMSLVCKGSESSHVDASSHYKATATEGKYKLEDLSPSSCPQIPAAAWRAPSQLLLTFNILTAEKNADLVMNYATEADISNFVASALKDAILFVQKRTGKKLELHHEVSLFSQRPDHLVLVEAELNAPILAVEYKKPYPDKSKNLIDKTAVIGQIFDYITAMQAFGHSAPFVVLTTFEKSTVFWKDDEKSNEIARDQNAKRSTFSFTSTPSKARCLTDTEKTASPPELKSEQKQKDDDEEDGYCFKTSATMNDRRLLHSTEYNSDKLVQLLYTAIICGLTRNPDAAKREISRPEVFYRGDALKMQEDSKNPNYEWGRLYAQLGKPIQCLSGSSSRTNREDYAGGIYFVIGIIGAGITSKVFLALDHAGKECVIKMYVKRDDESETFLNTKYFKKAARESTDAEARVLTETYNFLDGKVHSKWISGRSCVIMPFFKPLTKADRKSKEGEIKRVLGEIFFESGRMYKEDDLRWRHVGLYKDEHQTEHVVLYDLADLQAIGKGTSKENFVREQWGALSQGLEYEASFTE